jgi:oligosaccharide translocation protein RFT1
MMSETKVERQAVGGTLLLILIQVASRAFTFIGNQFLLRFLSPSLLGIAVQLELVSVTSLYFARESLRVALQRQPPTSNQGKNASTAKGNDIARRGKEVQSVVNLSYLAVVLGCGISTFFGYSYLRSTSGEVLKSPYFEMSFQIYAGATLIELLAEPAFVVIQQKGLYKDRARAETGAAMLRCFSACLVAVLGHRSGLDPSILPFAVGQAAYAGTILCLYLLPTLRLSKSENFSLIPQPLPSSSANSGYYLQVFHKNILSLAATMYMQSVFKLLLTQGDALIMSFLSSLAEQGAFALASNYGGLLARLVFQPVEEGSRNTLGRLLAPETTSAAEGKHKPASRKFIEPSSRDDAARARSNPRKIASALSYLATTLRTYLLFSLPLVVLAPPLLPLVTPLVLAPQWRTSATISLLQMYCYYIPFTALNGILDAFVTSVATPAQIRTQSLWMILFTAGYAGVAWVLMDRLGLGSIGLLGANIVNMGLRIIWSVVFLRFWVRENGDKETAEHLWATFLEDALPNAGAIGVAAALFASTKLTSMDMVDAKARNINLTAMGTWLIGALCLGAAL